MCDFDLREIVEKNLNKNFVFFWFYTKDLYKIKISVNFCDIHFFFFTYNILKNIVWFILLYTGLCCVKIKRIYGY